MFSFQSTTPQPNDEPSLGLIIPLSAMSLLLVVVGLCLLWHFIAGQRSKRARGQYVTAQVHGSFSEHLDSAFNHEKNSFRSSTRSTTPLRAVSEIPRDASFGAVEYLPGRLSKISESPEDRLARREEKRKWSAQNSPQDSSYDITDDTTSGDSILSMISKWKASIQSVSGGVPPPPPQSLPAFPDVSQSYPNLFVTAQAPFNPYRLTWVTPDSSQTRHSEPTILHAHQLPVMALTQRLNSLGTMSDDAASRHFSYSSWKSPYHPNYNTPTGSDTDSTQVPPNIVLNHLNSNELPDQPTTTNQLPEKLKASLHKDFSRMSNPPADFLPNQSKQNSSIYHTPLEGMSALSCPGNVGGYPNPYLTTSCELCQSRLLQNQTWGPAFFGDSYDNFHSAQASSNTSTCPMMGSSGNNSLVTSVSRPSMPYYMSHPAGINSAIDEHQKPTSRGTSVCVNVDSCETSRNGSNLTGQGNFSSGYQGGPSHSTSNNTSGGTTQAMETTVVGANSDETATLQGISAIEGASSDHLSSTNSTEHVHSYDVTDTDSSNQMCTTRHSAPAAFGSFNVTCQFDTSDPPNPPHYPNQNKNSPGCSQVEWEHCMTGRSRRSIASHLSEVLDPFSPASKTDSSIPSVSLSPFRVAALAALADRSAFHSLPSDNDVFLWDSTCEVPPHDGRCISVENPAVVPLLHVSPHPPPQVPVLSVNNSPPPPYTPPIPVLSDVRYWV